MMAVCTWKTLQIRASPSRLPGAVVNFDQHALTLAGSIKNDLFIPCAQGAYTAMRETSPSRLELGSVSSKMSNGKVKGQGLTYISIPVLPLDGHVTQAQGW